MMIRIGVQPAGEEPNQHIVHMAAWVSHTTTIYEVPTKSKSGQCSRDEVLAPSNHLARPSSWCLILPPLNHLEICCLILTPLNHLEAGRERFNKVVTGLLSLPGPIIPTCGQYKSKLVHRG
jgi:hypothetical protein